jgi:hypothetical protein
VSDVQNDNSGGANAPVQNTDRELWRERRGDYYADSIFVTESGGIGMNCGGFVIVKPIRDWHQLGRGAPPNTLPLKLVLRDAFTRLGAPQPYMDEIAHLAEILASLGVQVEGVPPEPRSDAAFQRLWTKYAALPEYVKAEWTAAFNELWGPSDASPA